LYRIILAHRHGKVTHQISSFLHQPTHEGKDGTLSTLALQCQFLIHVTLPADCYITKQSMANAHILCNYGV